MSEFAKYLDKAPTSHHVAMREYLYTKVGISFDTDAEAEAFLKGIQLTTVLYGTFQASPENHTRRMSEKRERDRLAEEARLNRENARLQKEGERAARRAEKEAAAAKTKTAPIPTEVPETDAELDKVLDAATAEMESPKPRRASAKGKAKAAAEVVPA